MWLNYSTKILQWLFLVMINEVKKNMLIVSKQIRNIYKEIRNVKKDQMENLEPKTYTIWNKRVNQWA